MLYEREADLIHTTLSEFVSLARRAFSKTAPSDMREPGNAPFGAKDEAARRLGLQAEPFTLDFSHSGYSFSLHGEVFSSPSGELALIALCGGDPKRPRREELAEARGEAFIGALSRAERLSLSEVKIRLIFINPTSRETGEIAESASIESLRAFFEKCKRIAEIYAAPEIERVTERLPSMRSLRFPYDKPREGQTDFMHAVFRTATRGGTLFATAPTGTGKTVSSLYPAIRALGSGKCEKVFYFTPKSSTGAAAEECIALMCREGAKIRSVTLASKERLCGMGVLCREERELCPHSKYNKICEAALELYKRGLFVVTPGDVRDFAKEFGVCPHELALTYSELCDVIICDINYLFDPKVYIRRHFSVGGEYAFLIDEAHNLPDRAREMYSASLSEEDIIAPSESALLGAFSKVKEASASAAHAFSEILFPYVREELRTVEGKDKVGAAHISEVPSELFSLIEELLAVVSEEIFSNYAARDEEKKERLKLLHRYKASLSEYLDVMYAFDGGYEMFIFYEGGRIRTKLFCIDPSKEIAERLSRGRCAVFFSATLSPLNYYKSVLGADGRCEMLELPSPFDSGQVFVTIMDKVSTRLSERDDSLSAVCRIIAATVSAKRGNYMIFSPSFAYSEALSRAFSAKYPKIRVLLQKKDMTEAEKKSFLSAFSEGDGSYTIGFCVMGGIYSEGIDLAGDSLIGAVVVGIGLPALSYEREAIAAYYQEKLEEGREFAYIYPGMNRVLQAAGRVIRREEDRGVIVLIDDRFDDPIYKKLIPKLWGKMKFTDDPKLLQQNLIKFWNGEQK